MAAKWKVYLRQVWFTTQIMNRLHFRKDEGVANAEAVAVEIRDNWLPHFRGIQTSQMIHTGIDVYDMTAPGSSVYSLALPNLPGLGSSTSNTGIVCSTLVTWRTGLAGRSKRGRIYIAGVRSTYGGPDQLNSTGITGTNGFLDLIKARFFQGGAGPLRLIVTADGYADNPMYNVTSYTTRQVYGVQRRRNLNVGV